MNGPADLDLIELQARTLFVHDDASRLVCVNEPSRPIAPRFFLGRTRAGNIWRLHHDLSSDLAHEIASLAAREPVVADLHAPYTHVQQIRTMLAAAAPIAREYSGPAFWFDTSATADTSAVLVTAENAAAFGGIAATMAHEIADYAPVFAICIEGEAVSVCFSARTGKDAAEAGVETLPHVRGRGLAPRAVGAWAAAIQAQEKSALYSTSWENQASQRVAEKLGLTMYGADLHFT